MVFERLFTKRDIMWLIVGLGNPGKKYDGTRHNIGFRAVDAVADSLFVTGFKSKFDGLWAETRLNDEKCGLLKPMSYMNNSGHAVAKAARFYKIPAEKVIVMHDDLDLHPGRIKYKQGGGHGGHNGLKSIDAQLGSQNYHRIRLGIGHPGKGGDVSAYVLSAFGKKDNAAIGDMLDRLSDNLYHVLDGEPDKLLNAISNEDK
jgi:PTH1 family peptidyl-tRNA hydrolase